MTDKLRAAAKAALETLDILSKLGNGDVDGNSKGNEIAQDARQNLRAALVETQMPTKICGPNLVGILNAAGFYRKKEWVGLTDDETRGCIEATIEITDPLLLDAVNAVIIDVERLLREKNT